METENKINNDMVFEMAQAGVVFGHKKSKTHPRMKQYIGGNKNEIELIDPAAIFSSLNSATEFLGEKISKGGLVLVVGTSPSAKEGVEEFAKRFSFPYVTKRWLGGTLTNFKVIQDRLKHFDDLKVKKEKGELSKYTKKERQEFDKEIGKLTQSFGGLVKLTRIPDVVFVVDIREHKIAVTEANKLNIPIVAIVDTDDDPSLVQYPIFANDHGRSSIKWILDKIVEEIKIEKPEDKKEE